jgi:hypothetical protein
MATITRKKGSKVGLTNGRIDWSLMENLACLANAYFTPFYGKVIGKASGGLTQGQVYERLKQTGYGLKDIRNGKCPITQMFVKKYSVENMTQATTDELTKQFRSMIP